MAYRPRERARKTCLRDVLALPTVCVLVDLCDEEAVDCNGQEWQWKPEIKHPHHEDG